jgi:hypothetical protein
MREDEHHWMSVAGRHELPIKIPATNTSAPPTMT